MFAYCHNTPTNAIDPTGYVITGFESGYDKANSLMDCGAGCSGGGGTTILFAAISAGMATLATATLNYTIDFLSSMAQMFSEWSYYLSLEGRIAKADAKIRSTVKEKSEVRYWTATVRKGYVDIGRPLTFNQAVNEVRAGRSVFAVTWYEAKAVALAAGGRSGFNNKALMPEIDSGKEGVPGYYYHYHTYDRSGGHVYYLFGEA